MQTRQPGGQPKADTANTDDSRLSQTAKCKCGAVFKQFKRYNSGRFNKKPFEFCPTCWKAEGNKGKSSGAAVEAEATELVSFMSSLECCSILSQTSGREPECAAIQPQPQAAREPARREVVDPPPPPSLLNAANRSSGAKGAKQTYARVELRAPRFYCPPNELAAMSLNHHIFTDEGWTRVSSFAHPRLRVAASVHRDDYNSLGVRCPTVKPRNIEVVADSGAQSCLWSRSEFL